MALATKKTMELEATRRIAEMESESWKRLAKVNEATVLDLSNISSTVTGKLLDDLTSWDALHAALPIGTVSGTPKVKAMELIGQPEVTRRGPCSGCKQASRMVCSHPSRDGSCG